MIMRGGEIPPGADVHNETIVMTGGCHDCGGRCVHRAHVRDGKVVRIETDDGQEPQLRSCLRGRAYRHRIYAPDRLRTPLFRIGARGEGKFRPASWDETLDRVAGELKRVYEVYGPRAVFLMWCTGGAGGSVHTRLATIRMLNMMGGFISRWGNLSLGGSDWASYATYGRRHTGNSRDDLVNSKLVLMWGWNPAITIIGTKTPYYLSRAKEAGARFIFVDPRFTDTAAALSDQWIPIRPGTDAAMLLAMAHVMISENLQDQRFLDTYTIGFERFKDYVMGREDGAARTPAWAEPITGVPAETIVRLAREYATTKPAALMTGWGPGRTAYGEQYNRAAITLAAMTGNIGISGGGNAGCGISSLAAINSLAATRTIGNVRFPSGDNPLERGLTEFPDTSSLDPAVIDRYRVHHTRVWDFLLEGKDGGYPGDARLLYIVGSNFVNQLPNTNKAVQALQRPEFIVHQEQMMTPTAKFADVVLPVSTHFERNDMYRSYMHGAYYIYANKAIEPLYESKSDFDIAVELARRLGLSDFSDKNEDGWLRHLFAGAADFSRDIASYDEFKREGVHKVPLDGPVIEFQEQIRDPEKHPFPTPSGKIEIFSQRLADLNNSRLPPLPEYIETWESRNDPLAAKYPLQLISPHSQRRAHSCFDNVDWLRETRPQTVGISGSDAAARGIADGELVRVFNDRGEVRLPARVTERIMPGVVEMDEGAWYAPDAGGIDHGGCPNVLTRDKQTPSGSLAFNTSLVQVAKV